MCLSCVAIKERCDWCLKKWLKLLVQIFHLLDFLFLFILPQNTFLLLRVSASNGTLFRKLHWSYIEVCKRYSSADDNILTEITSVFSESVIGFHVLTWRNPRDIYSCSFCLRLPSLPGFVCATFCCPQKAKEATVEKVQHLVVPLRCGLMLSKQVSFPIGLAAPLNSSVCL